MAPRMPDDDVSGPPIAPRPAPVTRQATPQYQEAMPEPAPRNYYPNGVQKRPMDERLPDGRTVAELLDPTMGTGIDMSRIVPIAPQLNKRYQDQMPEAPVAPAPSEPIAAIPDQPATASPYANIVPRADHPEDEADPVTRQSRLIAEGASKNSLWKRIAQGALRGAGAGGLGGALLGAAVEGISPRINQNFKTRGYLAETNRDIATVQDQKKKEADTDYTQARIGDIAADNTRMENKDRETILHKTRGEILRQYEHLPEFRNDDPDNADIIAAAKDVGLALPDKDAKHQFKYIVNAATGQTYVDVADATGNRHLQALVNDDGTPFTATTPQMMTATDKKAQRELQERIAKDRNITSVKVAELNAGSREKVAGINQSGASGRTAQTQAVQAAKVLAALEATAPPGSKPEAIQQKKSQYLNSLPPEVRALIPQ